MTQINIQTLTDPRNSARDDEILWTFTTMLSTHPGKTSITRDEIITLIALVLGEFCTPMQAIDGPTVVPASARTKASYKEAAHVTAALKTALQAIGTISDPVTWASYADVLIARIDQLA